MISKNDVVVIPKSESWLMRAIALFINGFEYFWTTYRLPLCNAVIAHPDRVTQPWAHKGAIEHEMFHVAQFAPWYGPFQMLLLATVFPLPVYWSGRWFIEREPYLNDIMKCRLSIDQAVDILWESYWKPWPKERMRKWFSDRIPPE